MTAVEVKPVKVFTRDEPCTKIDLFNCFRRGAKYVSRPVVETRGEIGVNSQKYLLRESYARMLAQGNIDFLALTPKGEVWLSKGILRYLELHPDESDKVEQPLPTVTPKQAPAEAKRPSVRVVVRRARGG
jgi:hypothetical protein